jgi:hypothetical protein
VRVTRRSIAVGMPVTRHPLHRSGREALPHPAPTLGMTANVPWATEGVPTTGLPYTRQRLGHARPALRPVRVTCRLFPLVTALPSTHSAAHRGALFAGFFGTMLVSDCSGPCIIGVEIGSSRCGPRHHRVASPELSQFPRKEHARMLGVSDRAEPEKHSRWRAPRCCLPLAHQCRRSGQTAFAAPYPAYVSPYRLLVCLLTETSARLGADVVR